MPKTPADWAAAAATLAHRSLVVCDLDDSISSLTYLATRKELPAGVRASAGRAAVAGGVMRAHLQQMRAAARKHAATDPEKPA